MSEHPFGKDLQTEPPRRPGPLKRLVRGLLIGAVVGAIIGAGEGAALMLLFRSAGQVRTAPALTTEQVVSIVLDRAIVFGFFGAILVGLSLLIFGGRTPPDKERKP
jgi:hypothetical protein